MQGEQEYRPWPLIATVVLLTITAGCGASVAHQEKASSSTSQDDPRAQTINHLSPARDSIGAAPARFSWTPIAGADSYSIGVWSEVDVLVWRQNNLSTTSVTLPDDVRFEPGTYFWTVSALSDGRQIAESGLAAFVVRD